MRFFIIVPAIVTVVQSISTYEVATESRLFRRADSNKRLSPDSPPAQIGRQRITRTQSSGSRDETRTSPQRNQLGHGQNGIPERIATEGHSSQAPSSLRGRVGNQMVDLRSYSSLGRGRSPSPEVNPNRASSSHPSASSTPSPELERNRFPSPRAGLQMPDRSKHVKIHTGIDGPARVTGYLGQAPLQSTEIVVPAGGSLNKVWSDSHQAEVHVRTFEGGHGVHRAWAAGGRRASIRTDAVPRHLHLGSHVGIGGPVSDLKVEHEDPQHGVAGGYIKASTRSYENHVGVDSMFEGTGLTVLRASNSRAGTASRPSSLTMSNLGSGSGSGDEEVVSGVH